jgi:uncharacterized membrane protein YtjA (UPF0391 family)
VAGQLTSGAFRPREHWNQQTFFALSAHQLMQECCEDRQMSLLKWALIFFIVSIVAGILGFTGVSAASADIARVLFYVFGVIFLVLLLLGLTIFRA